MKTQQSTVQLHFHYNTLYSVYINTTKHAVQSVEESQVRLEHTQNVYRLGELDDQLTQEERLTKNWIMSGIKLRIYDLNTSAQTTEPQTPHKSQSFHFLLYMCV